MTLSANTLDAHGWPTLDDDELPAFPVDVLPGDVRAFVNALAEESQTPPDLAAMAALGVLSAAAMDTEVDCGLWTEESLGLYLLTAMPSGDRKSTVLRAALAPLRAREREQREAAAPQVDEERTRRDVLEVRKKKLTKTAGETEGDDRKVAEAELAEVDERLRDIGEPSLPRLLADDLTPESLGGLLAQHGQIAVIAAESAFLDNLSGRYNENGANLHLVCAAYQGETTSIDRRNRDPEILERPLVSVALSIQPHVLAALVAHPIARAQGLVSRFAYSMPRSLLGRRNIDAPRASAAVCEKWANCVNCVSDQAENYRRNDDNASHSVSNVSTTVKGFSEPLSLSESAISLLSALRSDHEPRLAEDGDLRPVMDWANRHPGRIVRVAGLLHLIENDRSEPISVDMMARALEIGDYLLAHAIAALTGPDPLTTRALQWLKGRSAVTTRELQRGPLGSRGTAEDAATLASVLVEHGALRPAPTEQSGPGRPASPVFEVHPQVCGVADGTDKTRTLQVVA
jgi:replicative DNA helicase